MAPLRLRIDGRVFRDEHDREITLHGINVAGDAKFPTIPDLPSHVAENFFEGDTVSFVGRPFSVDEAHVHFARLKRYGYNTIRYVFTWEAIEHAGPGTYDEEWIQHTISVLRLAGEYGFMVFMDPHQDVWSRFSGGSGAPMWTIYACGLNPKTFHVTEAALVQNVYKDPITFPKMIWATNYQRMACQVIFTLFFAGREFAPKAVIDGKNIQDYLQDHFHNACRHLAQRMHEAGGLENEIVIGWETLNEPNRGMIGWHDLAQFPSEIKLRKGSSPTAWQAILNGSGRACEVETWEFGGMGPFKSGSVLVDPEGQSAWLPTTYDDTFYGWKRDPDWRLGECLWAQHGIWDPATDALVQKNYFSKDPRSGKLIDYEYFTNHWFMDFYRRYRDAIRSVFSGSVIFCQPPVLEIPPALKGSPDDDPNMVFAPHFYDGITLMTKKWNRIWNVDVFGVLRGKYWSPAFAVKIGETAIRNCFKDQLTAIQKEGMDYMGTRPCVFTEIGIPYDMDDQYAYKTGDYTSQTLAMDANHFALEGSNANGFTLWVYVASNNHKWGDQWNGEDLSIFSKDDRPLPLSPFSRNQSTASFDNTSPSFSQSQTSEAPSVTPSTLKDSLSPHAMSSKTSKSAEPGSGFRAAEAYIRPTPITTCGDIVSYGFDLRNCVFKLELITPSATSENAPTEVFLPEFHFPPGNTTVEVSGGKWQINIGDKNNGLIQILRWWHAAGEQTITVKGVIQRPGLMLDKEEEAGYIEQCQQRNCTLM
ncbi:glycosyl hydrolase-like protein [Pseudovirgaria hyperparasitica]|uniref:Glycosyl hydrolase-like protein n=1 Tax=Pseudovirgaria hyperparasitica TaxID=470096 RepID=A0A6A6W819_9PEZI|nr:glycosyl hydrolase-like protein [Pseudovirgaria hyperparasitica]KAF2758174.1 glycosyl hydrolase-like protein [Pseudovirgaria hyperparasitica]